MGAEAAMGSGGAVLQGVLAGAALVAAILFGVWRMLEAQRKENRDAHAGINQRIERQGETLNAIARDVSFLAGRQAERDQSK